MSNIKINTFRDSFNHVFRINKMHGFIEYTFELVDVSTNERYIYGNIYWLKSVILKKRLRVLFFNEIYIKNNIEFFKQNTSAPGTGIRN